MFLNTWRRWPTETRILSSSTEDSQDTLLHTPTCTLNHPVRMVMDDDDDDDNGGGWTVCVTEVLLF